MGAGHSNDDEDDQRPDDQSQGPKLEQRKQHTISNNGFSKMIFLVKYGVI